MEDENAVIGAGYIENFNKQQLLQTLACTECGRCQDKCPAWNTGKPLNPKLVITSLRDQMFAESDRLIGAQKVGDRQRTALGNPHYPSLFPLQERFPRLGPREHAKGDVYEEDT